MLFSSISFLYFFLPLTLFLYFLVPQKGKNLVLLFVSVLFYAKSGIASGKPPLLCMG